MNKKPVVACLFVCVHCDFHHLQEQNVKTILANFNQTSLKWHDESHAHTSFSDVSVHISQYTVLWLFFCNLMCKPKYSLTVSALG